MPSLAAAFRVFKVHWSDIIQYRLDLTLWTLEGIFEPLIAMAMWYAASSNSLSSALQPSQVLSYFIIFIVVRQVSMSWHGIFLIQEILNGTIVQHLIRPFPVILHWLSNNFAEKLIKVSAVSVGVVMFTYLTSVKMELATNPATIAIFVFSLLLGMIIQFSLTTILGLIAFWLEDAHEVNRYSWAAEYIAAGILIPYAFMPTILARTLSLFPFRYMYATPTEILVGQTSTWSLPVDLGIQLAWAIALPLAAWHLWRRGLKRYVVPGQ